MKDLVNIESEGTKQLQVFDFNYSKLSYFEKKDKLKEFKESKPELYSSVMKIINMRDEKLINSDSSYIKLKELKDDDAFIIFFLLIDVITHRYLYIDDIPATNRDIDLSIVARYKFDMSSNIISNNIEKMKFIKNMDIDTYSKIKQFTDVYKMNNPDKTIKYDNIAQITEFFNNNEFYKILSPLMFTTTLMYLIMYIPSDTELGVNLDEVKIKLNNKINTKVNIDTTKETLINKVFDTAILYKLSSENIDLFNEDNFIIDIIKLKDKFNVSIDEIIDILIAVIPLCTRNNICDKSFNIISKLNSDN